MSHTGESNSTFVERIIRAGASHFFAAGENIASGYAGVTAVMDGWMRSSGHRANILGNAYTHIGVAVELNGKTPYWCCVFAKMSINIQSAIEEDHQPLTIHFELPPGLEGLVPDSDIIEG